MTQQIAQDIGHDIHLIDLAEHGVFGRTGCYVIRGEKTALVDVGTSYARERILSGLAELGIAPEDVDYVLITHIHLDHSAGLGYLLPLLPNATVVCHPRAARHLIDPTRLLAGARAVYGDTLEAVFGEILPVPAERVMIRDDEETLDLGNGHFLTFYDTPGHARHHFSIHDPAADGIFTGDTVGLRFVPELTGWDFTYLCASTSPSEFDRDAVMRSCDRLEQLNPARIYVAHFGAVEPASLAFARTRETADAMDRLAREAYVPSMSWEEIADKLREYVLADLAKLGHSVTDLSGLELDIEVNAKGLLYMLKKEQLEKEHAAKKQK